MHNRPTTVAVIADTHANHLDELPPRLRDALTRADHIIHLGDYTSPELLDELRQLGDFHGIAGNHDDRLLHKELEEMTVIEVRGWRLGLIHGLFWPVGSQKRMKAWFSKHKIDVLLYGHTHLATSRYIDDIFVFNPGTVTGQFPAYYGSFGVLTLDGTVSAEIFHLDGLPNEKKIFPGRFCAWPIQNTVRWIETWPYVDLRQCASDVWSALKRCPAGARFLGRKTAEFLQGSSGQGGAGAGATGGVHR